MKLDDTREPYVKPVIIKHDNLRTITFECSNWQCSVAVPTSHPAGP